MTPTSTHPKEASMTAHTPGPWSVRRLARCEAVGYRYQVGGEGIHTHVAQAVLEHDAHLIAAAPSLYEALKAMHKRLITEASHLPDDDEFLAIERASQTAIAHAEGRTP